MFENAPQPVLNEALMAQRRERMLPGLLREVRVRRRRRRAMRAAGAAAVLALVGAAVLVAVPILKPRPSETLPREAREPARDVAPVVARAVPSVPQPRVARVMPRENKPLIITVGTAPGLAERWGSVPTSVRVVMVDDEQLLASLNESGERYGLMRMGDAATLVPRRER